MEKELLIKEYTTNGLSTRDIAKKYHISQTTVRRLMKKFGIKARKSGERTEYNKEKMRPTYERYAKEYRRSFQNKCQYCSQYFSVGSHNKRKKYCSDKCLSLSKRSETPIFYCELCGCEIENVNNRNYLRRFCPKCLLKHRSVSQTNRVKTQCGYCGSDILVIPARFKQNKFSYCDVKCMALHYSEIYTGENSFTWTGGKRHYQGDWIKQRNLARERDEYSCQICGINETENNRELDVHHIILYKKFENKYEANELSNLVCLCHSCHRFVHSNQNIDNVYIIK